MSRYYEMSVEITGYQSDRTDAIKAAAQAEWPLEDWYALDGALAASADANLCGGESEEEFTERVSLAIWKANGKYCEVKVDAIYMDDLSPEKHCLSQSDYERLMNPDKATP